MNLEAATRVVVKNRSMGWCERCGRIGQEMHHRKNRSQGGDWRASNITLLCLSCHNWVGSNPNAARLVGLHVREPENPADIPIRTGDVPYLLDDDGGFVACCDSDVLSPMPGVKC